MKPIQHAKATAQRIGGHWSHYIALHTFIDSSKASFAGTQHRMLLHSALGVELAARKFGETIVDHDGKALSVRAAIEDHLLEDVGFVPTLDQWLETLSEEVGPKRPRRIPPEISAFADDPIAACIKRWGGDEATYRPVVDFFDLTGTLSEDPRHLYFLHNSFGIFLAEDIGGYAVKTPQGREVAVRDIAEALVQARMRGYILSPHQICEAVRLKPWMYGAKVAEGLRARKQAAA